jgi:hypothetical protein
MSGCQDDGSQYSRADTPPHNRPKVLPRRLTDPIVILFSSLLIFSTGCKTAWMRSQNSDAAIPLGSPLGDGSAVLRAQSSHEGDPSGSQWSFALSLARLKIATTAFFNGQRAQNDVRAGREDQFLPWSPRSGKMLLRTGRRMRKTRNRRGSVG